MSVRSRKRKNSPPKKEPCQPKSSEAKCQDRLTKKLMDLVEKDVLHNSLCPGVCRFVEKTNEFEVLEFYGDAFLYERVSFFLMTTRRFLDPHLLTTIRVACIRNSNLAEVYDALRLSLLCPTPVPLLSNLKLLTKWKGDIVEAIIGELAEASDDTDASMLLNELLAFVSYCGEKAYFDKVNTQSGQNLPEIEEITLADMEKEPKLSNNRSSPPRSPQKKPSTVPPKTTTSVSGTRKLVDESSTPSLLKRTTPALNANSHSSTNGLSKPPAPLLAEPQQQQQSLQKQGQQTQQRSFKSTSLLPYPSNSSSEPEFNPLFVLDMKNPSLSPLVTTSTSSNSASSLSFERSLYYGPQSLPSFLTPSEVRRQTQPLNGTGAHSAVPSSLFPGPLIRPSQMVLST